MITRTRSSRGGPWRFLTALVYAGIVPGLLTLLLLFLPVEFDLGVLEKGRRDGTSWITASIEPYWIQVSYLNDRDLKDKLMGIGCAGIPGPDNVTLWRFNFRKAR